MSVSKMPRTNDNLTLLVLRLFLGGVFFPHGAQKLLGWFGGPGVAGEIHAMQSFLHIPPPLTVCVIVAEFFGALGLVSGLLTRLSALGVLIVMVVAVAMEHGANGFFMNWFGTQKGEGFEYHLLAIGLALPLLVRGGGQWSADTFIARRQAARPAPAAKMVQ